MVNEPPACGLTLLTNVEGRWNAEDEEVVKHGSIDGFLKLRNQYFSRLIRAAMRLQRKLKTRSAKEGCSKACQGRHSPEQSTVYESSRN
jgi:hypothetical protein